MGDNKELLSQCAIIMVIVLSSTVIAGSNPASTWMLYRLSVCYFVLFKRCLCEELKPRLRNRPYDVCNGLIISVRIYEGSYSVVTSGT
jgi:hypothetical protein